jgi:hypothetical protein
MERPRRGYLVYLMSGRQVGVVDSVCSGSFSVVADGADRIWLRDDSIFTVSAGKVRLVCEAHGLRDYTTATAPRV